MKTKLTTIVLLLTCSTTFSQSPFNKEYPLVYPPDYFLKMVQLSDKGYFLYGGWNYPTAGFLAKIDTYGTMLWAKQIENPGNLTVPVLSSAIRDNDQHLLITTQDPYPSTGSLLKLDTAGNALWDIRFDFPVSDVVLTSDGNYAVVGRKNIAVFGQNAEIQFYKISPSGSVIFGYQYYNTNNFINYNNLDKNTYGLIQHADGNYFVLAHINEDIFIMKINANGQLIWNKKYWQTVFNSPYVLRDAPWKMTLMPDSSILVCGQKDHSFSHDLICFKINSAGNVLWSKDYLTNVSNHINRVNTMVDAEGAVCIYLELTDSSEMPAEQVIFTIDQGGNLINAFSLRIPGKPFFPMWFGLDASNHYQFIQRLGIDTAGNDTVQVVLMDSLFHSPCVTDTFAALAVQNFPVDVIDSFPLITQLSSTSPILDNLIFTPKDFSNIDYCLPTELNTPVFAAKSLSIFPNPAHDILTIEYDGSKQSTMQLQLLNIFGAVIYDEQVENYNCIISRKINLGNLAAGIYFIKAGTEVKKFARE